MRAGHTMLFRGWRLLALLTLLGIGMLSIMVSAPQSVGAEAVPGTLTGQHLYAEDSPGGAFGESNITLAGVCNRQGTSTFNFTMSGIAFGPYNGTFTERGSFTLSPQPDYVPGSSVPAPGFQPGGRVVAFEASFTILAGDTTITGTKAFTATEGALCGQLVFESNPSVSRTQGYAYTTFQATINSPAGTFTESGTTIAGVSETIAQSAASCLVKNVNTGECVAGRFATGGEDFLTSTRSLGPATLTLSPVAAVNPVGTGHTVTATALNATGQSVQGVTVRFTVTGSSTATGSCTTDAQGRCAFTYQGPQLPGADLITAYADTDNDGAQDPGEPVGEATKAWVLPTTTPGQVTGGGQIGTATGERVTFGFNAQSTDRGLKGTCTVIDQATDTKVKCLDVTALVQSGTHATFFGRAEVDGVPTTYRIDVDDLGEPGKGRDTFQIQTAGGYVAGGVLTQGNIQIHKP